MAENKKYFLDFNGLQSLWDKMKSTFASKSEIGTINDNLAVLNSEIEGVEAITLSYAPKTAENYSNALTIAETAPAGTVIIVGNDEELDGVTYTEGFYIVDTNKSIHYIGTGTGTTDENELANLRNRISELEKNIITHAVITNSNGEQLGYFTIANNSLLVTYDDEVIANSESVNALTHRAIAAKFGELESRLTSIPKFKISVVDELPIDEISHSTIYLVKSSDVSQNMYTEYIYIQNIGWEKLGEQSIVLDNYVTKDFLTTTLNDAFKNYATKKDVEDSINNLKSEVIEEVKNDVLTSISTEYLTKSEASNLYLTEEEILTSIQSGTIGETIMITEEQINALS